MNIYANENGVFINDRKINRAGITKDMIQGNEDIAEVCFWELGAELKLAGIKSTDLKETELSMMVGGKQFNPFSMTILENAICDSVKLLWDYNACETALQIIWVVLRELEKANGEEVLDYKEWHRKNTEAD